MTRFDRMTAKSHSKPCNLLKRLFAERHPKVGEKNPEKVAFRSEGRAPIFFLLNQSEIFLMKLDLSRKRRTIEIEAEIKY